MPKIIASKIPTCQEYRSPQKSIRLTHVKNNKVGTSGLRVGHIGLGTLTWGRDTEYDDAARMTQALIDAGGNLIDISPLYGEASQLVFWARYFLAVYAVRR